ncbi:hypothetical protein ACFQL5_11690 [Aquipuribacter hungaricus]|uniref:hypothetical protein n=1 Tax=Aquipuribacter hungaricus TaxID=545624 RepID=UPI00360CC9E5
MTGGPLWARAPLRLLREGPWAVLVVAAFAVSAAAAASDVLTVSAWRTASVARTLDAVAEGAGPLASPTVRVSGSPGPGRVLEGLREQVDAVPGLEPASLLGVSFADELLGTRLVRYEGFAEVDGRRRTARLTAVDEPGDVLQVVASAPVAEGEERPAGVWVPADLAEELSLEPGDEMQVVTSVSRRQDTAATTTVAGVYEVDAGAVPVDLPGSRFWQDRAGRLPGDTGGLAQPSVLVGDPSTTEALADAIGDVLIWSLDAGLDPVRPDRDALGSTVSAVQRLRTAAAALPPGESVGTVGSGAILSPVVVTGLPGLLARADDITLRAAAEARTPAVGSILLGLALVLAVSTLTASRRARELELLAGLGVRPPAVGALGVAEVLPAALLGLLLGGPGAWLAVRALAGASPGEASLGLAAGQAAVVVGAGVLLHAVVMAVAAAGAARRGARHSRPQRSLPWRPVLVAAAVAAVAGLLAAPVGEARGLDLSVPVLVSAAVGAVGASLLRLVAAGRGPRPHWGTARRVVEPSSGSSRLGPGTVGALVVRRRLAAGGAERLLVVTALATAFGLAAHVLVGAELVARSVEDKAAVLAGAPVVVELDQAGQVDPDLPGEGYARDVRTTEGDSVVFRDSGRLLGDRVVDVAVVDLATVEAVASWGSPGGPLDRARGQLGVLAEADAAARPECPSLPLGGNALPSPDEPPPPACPPAPAEGEGVPLGGIAPGPAPVLVVGERAGLRDGALVRLASPTGDVPLRVVGSVEAFPGVDPDLRTGIVAATGSYLPRLPNGDPRLTTLTDGRGEVSKDLDGVELWSVRPLAAVAADLPAVESTAAALSDERRTRTAGESLGRPAFVAVALVEPYLRVLAGLVLLVALLALCLSVDRATARARAGDLVLARVGLGRGGTRRLLVVESVVLVVAGLALGALGWLLTVPLLPRLLEPEPSVRPLLDPVAVPQAGAVLVAAAMLALLAAVLVVRAGTRSTSEEEVLRGQD